jgi:hypothetical protein
MKLIKALKNRKGMTPLMIGIIVAASVIAVIFVVMAAVITVLPHDITMTLRDSTIKGVNTQHLKLEFQIQCENEDGVINKIEIYHDGLLYGHTDDSYFVDYRTTEEINIDFFIADEDTPIGEITDIIKLLFVPDQSYVLTVYYQNIDASNIGTVSLAFIYNIPS